MAAAAAAHVAADAASAAAASLGSSGAANPAAASAFFHAIGLPLLDSYWPLVAGSALACQALSVATAAVSRSTPAYRDLSPAHRFDWRLKAVSFVHSLLVACMAVPVFLDPHFRSNRFREYTDYSTTLFSITCGYFLWDSLVCVTQIASNGVGPFVHGLACFAVYIFFAKPIFHYYGAVFLMFELSTPFLNAHWLLSKMGRLDAKTKTLLQGLIYAIFFLVRVLFGPYQSFYFFVNVRDQWDVVPKFAVAVFSVACVALNSLNMLWFYKMTMYIVDGNSKKKTVHRGD